MLQSCDRGDGCASPDDVTLGYSVGSERSIDPPDRLAGNVSRVSVSPPTPRSIVADARPVVCLVAAGGCVGVFEDCILVTGRGMT